MNTTVAVDELARWGGWRLRDIRRAALALGIRPPRTLSLNVMSQETAYAVADWLQREAAKS